VDIKGLFTWVELYNLVFQLTYSANGALKCFLDKYALLRMHALIVALLKLAIDVDVFDVEHCQELKDFIIRPVFNLWPSNIIQDLWLCLVFRLKN